MNRDYQKPGRTPTKMASGGQVGVIERFRAGNIDDPQSDAYWRWGAGSDESSSDAVESARLARTPAPAPEIPDAAPRQSVGNMADLPVANSGTEATEDRKFTPEITTKKPTRVRRTPKSKPVSNSFSAGLASGIENAVAARDARRVDNAIDKANKPVSSQTERDARHAEEFENTPVAKGLNKVSGFLKGVGKVISGIANSKPTYTPENWDAGRRAVAMEAANRTARTGDKTTVGMKHGGMVGCDRNYSKR